MSPWGRGCLATGGARTGGGGLAWAQWMRAVQEGECGCLCAGVTFQAVLPGHPKTSPSRGERGGANLGDPERQGETGREGVRASWPSTRTSAGVLHPTFPLPAGRNRSRHEGLSMEQPPQLGGISLPVPHLMDTHPRFLEGRLSSRSPRSYFLGRPLFLPFFPYSPTCQPSPFPCAHGGGQELLPGGLTGGSQRKRQLPSFAQHFKIPEPTGKSRVSDNFAALQAAQGIHLRSQQSLWQLYQATRLV